MSQLNILKSPLVKQLVEEYRENKHVYESKRIDFGKSTGKDIYNISSPLEFNGKEYLLGRMEHRDSEISEVGIFEKTGELKYDKLISKIPLLQDPFYTFINQELYIGGTEIYLNPDKEITTWATSFYHTKDLIHFHRELVSPNKMKDVRIAQNNKIHIFTRPQGGQAKLGRIGHVIIDDLSKFSWSLLANADLFENQFDELSWGGVNQVLELKNGLFGILGHVACMSEGDVRHYYGMTFCYNPNTDAISDMKIICERSDFVAGKAKRPDLEDVVFPGGIVRKENNRAVIYAGISDVFAATLEIDDPFTEYET